MANLKLLHFTIIFVFLLILAQTKGLNNPRILDESSPDLENKCGNCPCNTPCNQSPPPPPPSSPPPPPPSSPPPPPKKTSPPPGNYCPPPPDGQYPPNPPYIFMNGPPGNLYPVDADLSGSGRSSFVGTLSFLISCLVAVLATRFLVNN